MILYPARDNGESEKASFAADKKKRRNKQDATQASSTNSTSPGAQEHLDDSANFASSMWGYICNADSHNTNVCYSNKKRKSEQDGGKNKGGKQKGGKGGYKGKGKKGKGKGKEGARIMIDHDIPEATFEGERLWAMFDHLFFSRPTIDGQVDFILDSGATRHIVGHKRPNKITGHKKVCFQTAANTEISSHLQGHYNFHEFNIRNACFIPDCNANLLSVSQLQRENNAVILFGKDKNVIKLEDRREIPIRMIGKSYVVSLTEKDQS